jgi:hypothetical protein
MSENNITLVPEPPDPGEFERSLAERSFEDIAASLDAESHGIVNSVLLRDTADAQAGLARRLMAEAQSDLKRLKQAQDAVGTREQMQAIKRTGQCPDARFWQVAAWCFVLVDALFWFIATAQAFKF